MKRALLIGNDHYDRFQDLAGCANDANALHPLLARNHDGSPNFECRVGVDQTRDQLISGLDALLAPGAESGLFFFAGHGGSTPSDVTLVSSDGTDQTPGLKFSELLAMITSSKVPELVVILDCCFAGGAGSVPLLAGDTAAVRPGLSILAASRNDQTSAETKTGRGLFSTFVEGALEGGASDTLGRVDLGGMYAYVSESFGAWEQRPTFKANIDRPQELRQCTPPIPTAELRQVLDLFSSATSELPLDPSYEPDANPSHPEHERIFAMLQKARAARLVEPVGEEHLYFAAMSSTACKLTPLGAHYHRVHADGRL